MSTTKQEVDHMHEAHKKKRVERYQEFLLRREKRKLVLSNLEGMFPKGKAPAMVAKDVKAQNAWSSCSPQLLIMGVPCCWLTQS